MGLDAKILGFFNLSFKLPFTLSSFTLIKRFFNSSSLPAIRAVSSASLRLLLFLPAILIPAWDLSSLVCHMLYSAYKLNKQVDTIQLCYTSLPNLNQSVVPCLVLTVAYWPACKFLRRQIRWPVIPIFLIIFQSVLWFTQSKAFA